MILLTTNWSVLISFVDRQIYLSNWYQHVFKVKNCKILAFGLKTGPFSMPINSNKNDLFQIHIIIMQQKDKCNFEILTIFCKIAYEISNSLWLNFKRETINTSLLFLEHTHISYVHDFVIKERFNMSSYKSNRM